MKTERFGDEFEYFYLELPQADYLNDLDDIQIQDEHFEDYESEAGGLSDEQVSKLAGDALGTSDLERAPKYNETIQSDQGLFPDQPNDN